MFLGIYECENLQLCVEKFARAHRKNCASAHEQKCPVREKIFLNWAIKKTKLKSLYLVGSLRSCNVVM